MVAGESEQLPFHCGLIYTVAVCQEVLAKKFLSIIWAWWTFYWGGAWELLWGLSQDTASPLLAAVQSLINTFAINHSAALVTIKKVAQRRIVAVWGWLHELQQSYAGSITPSLPFVPSSPPSPIFHCVHWITFITACPSQSTPVFHGLTMSNCPCSTSVTIKLYFATGIGVGPNYSVLQMCWILILAMPLLDLELVQFRRPPSLG